MRPVVLIIPLSLLLTGASCPGPEPWNCETQQQAMTTARDAQARAAYYRVRQGAPGRYIVTLRQGWLRERGAMSAEAYGSEIQGLAQGYGATDVEIYAAVDQFSCSMTRSQMNDLRRDPRVLFIEQDGVKAVSPLAGTEAATWGLDRIDQRNLPLDGVFDPGNDGGGIHAYVIDTGVDGDHPEFEGRLGEAFSAVGDRIDDDHGHGTHVAGTLAGKTFGVARQVVIHAVRVLRNGSGRDSVIIQGIDWATAHAQENGWPAVANMSLGGDTSRSLDTAVCRSLAGGMTHVVAAGNEDTDACGGSPAHVLQALTLGASDDRDRRATFSNFGRCVDLFAPGVDVKSAWRGGGTRTISGTSMASPHAAGVAALALERAPGSTPAEIHDAVVAAATEGVVRNPRDSPNRLLYARED